MQGGHRKVSHPCCKPWPSQNTWRSWCVFGPCLSSSGTSSDPNATIGHGTIHGSGELRREQEASLPYDHDHVGLTDDELAPEQTRNIPFSGSSTDAKGGSSHYTAAEWYEITGWDEV